jgi:uncharacterized protein (TIGR02246 family)
MFKNRVVWLALAAGALLGWAATSFDLGFSPPAKGADAKKETIEFVVRLPAEASLEIDGNKTTETGTSRTFLTPPLPVEGRYSYTLKATLGAKEVTRTVHLAHGLDNTVDLRAEFLAAAPNKPDAKQITGSGAPNATNKKEDVRGNPKEEAALQKNAEGFIEAFHKGDAKAVAAFWVPDGEFIDQTGRQVKGREAIEKAFTALFAENKGLKLRVEGTSLRFVTPDVAIEDGTTEAFPPDGAPPTRGRYTNVHVKKDGQWLLSSVRESPFTPPSNYPHLRGLEWALGDWAGEAEEGGVERLSVAWSDNQNFLTGTFSTTIKNVPIASATHRIGWDPEAKRIRSWIFDASGGFGEGSWTQDGKKWVVKTNSVLQDGKKAAATYLLTPVDADTITLQARDRSEDGNPIPNTKEVKMKRVK